MEFWEGFFVGYAAVGIPVAFICWIGFGNARQWAVRIYRSVVS